MADKDKKDIVKDYLTEAWYSFKHAIYPDLSTKTYDRIAGENGFQRGTSQRLMEWFKKYWALTLFAILILRYLFVSVNSNRPSKYRDGRKSHHGINKWGESY